MKNLKYVFFTFAIYFISISSVFAADDLENFCTGAVQGVFTTLGWVFFFVKIFIPILLIIIGTIDFGKAIVSGKPEEEVKKTMQKLAIKAIAGIVIFFIPGFLGLIVDVIGGENVYSQGSFANCTKCMLNPNAENCASIGGH